METNRPAKTGRFRPAQGERLKQAIRALRTAGFDVRVMEWWRAEGRGRMLLIVVGEDESVPPGLHEDGCDE